jgi:hypothetical protein
LLTHFTAKVIPGVKPVHDQGVVCRARFFLFFKSCAKKWDVWRYWVVGSEDMLKDIIPTARCKLFTRLASPVVSKIHKVLYKYK